MTRLVLVPSAAVVFLFLTACPLEGLDNSCVKEAVRCDIIDPLLIQHCEGGLWGEPQACPLAEQGESCMLMGFDVDDVSHCMLF